jgi:hypothetical protein
LCAQLEAVPASDPGASRIPRHRASCLSTSTESVVRALLAAIPKLREAEAAAAAWLQRAQLALADDGGAADLKALEALAADASRIPVALPEAKPLRERAAAARKVADSIRALLPGASRDAARAGRGRKDADHVNVEYMRCVGLRA